MLASSAFIGLVAGHAGAATVDGRSVWLNGNLHEYILVSAPIRSLTWESARSDAMERFPGYDLATITSREEQDFVDEFLAGLSGIIPEERWLGGFQSPPDQPVASAGWKWVTGEPFQYNNWNQSGFVEPNDFYGPGSEQYMGIWPTASSIGTLGAWNDEANSGESGYLAESLAAVPIGSSQYLILVSFTLLFGCTGLTRLKRFQG